MVTVASVEKGSICDKLGIRAGDSLVAINAHEIYDILDYRFHLCEKKIKLTVLEKLTAPLPGRLRYFNTSGHLNSWEYFPGSQAVTYF